jgi:hypothetical protein
MTLDFGQKLHGVKRCVECEMVYNFDDKEDCDLHTRYHKRKDNLLKFTGWKNEKLVQSYIDGRCIVIEADIDGKNALNKAAEVLKYVDAQLGIRNFNDVLKIVCNFANGLQR